MSLHLTQFMALPKKIKNSKLYLESICGHPSGSRQVFSWPGEDEGGAGWEESEKLHLHVGRLIPRWGLPAEACGQVAPLAWVSPPRASAPVTTPSRALQPRDSASRESNHGHLPKSELVKVLCRQASSGFSDSSVGKESACNAGDPSLIPGLGRSPGEGKGYPLQYSWASLVAQLIKNPPAMQETWVRSLGWEDPPEKGKATHSSIQAWRIPWAIHGVTKSQTWLSNFHFTSLPRLE